MNDELPNEVKFRYQNLRNRSSFLVIFFFFAVFIIGRHILWNSSRGGLNFVSPITRRLERRVVQHCCDLTGRGGQLSF